MAKFTIGIEGTDPIDEKDIILGEGVKRGDIVYLSEIDRKFYLASSSVESSSNASLWIADGSGNAGDTIPLIDRGYFTYSDEFPEMVPGKAYYLSNNPGQKTDNPPRTSGNFQKYVGKAINRYKLLFDPDPTFVEGDGSHINGIKINGDKYFEHDQNIASTEWICNHNLGKYPSITVKNSANDTIIGKITFTNENTVTIRFNVAVSGKAYFN